MFHEEINKKTDKQLTKLEVLDTFTKHWKGFYRLT